jgi:hypothetical protein
MNKEQIDTIINYISLNEKGEAGQPNSAGIMKAKEFIDDPTAIPPDNQMLEINLNQEDKLRNNLIDKLDSLEGNYTQKLLFLSSVYCFDEKYRAVISNLYNSPGIGIGLRETATLSPIAKGFISVFRREGPPSSSGIYSMSDFKSELEVFSSKDMVAINDLLRGGESIASTVVQMSCYGYKGDIFDSEEESLKSEVLKHCLIGKIVEAEDKRFSTADGFLSAVDEKMKAAKLPESIQKMDGAQDLNDLVNKHRDKGKSMFSFFRSAPKTYDNIDDFIKKKEEGLKPINPQGQ